MALLSISVVPVGTASPSIGDYIAQVVKVCERAKVKYRLTDMGTIVEGKPADLFDLARKLHETPFRQGVRRVYTTFTLDDRRDKRVRLDDKTASVLSRLET
ncbi:MAG: MTH1187 family thiamine-binding protein [Nitrospirae bacterium]|nr:MTH1187 family thiamine-binding protein [Nitrospirota bacterium]